MPVTSRFYRGWDAGPSSRTCRTPSSTSPSSRRASPAGSRFSAEDRGFEPLRAFTQHAFQACALGHYANPPPRRLPERTACPEIAADSRRLCLAETVADAASTCHGCASGGRLAEAIRRDSQTCWPPVYTGGRHPVWWYLSELPQGRNAARVGELFQVRGVSLFVRKPPTSWSRPAGRRAG